MNNQIILRSVGSNSDENSVFSFRGILGTLNSYDIENAGNLYFYFLAVCNFYGQYYDSLSRNRYIYLEQANMSSKLLVWFGKNIDALNDRLRKAL